MKKVAAALIAIALIAVLICEQDRRLKPLNKFVAPFIGVEDGGHVFPGAACPFGMVKLGPDCGDKSSNSGYFSAGVIQGFSHTHVSGTGGGAKYGNILVMPTTGEVDLSDCGSLRSNERATPGFYGVHLDRYGIDVELTVTHSVGCHRYTFPSDEKAQIVIDAGSFLQSGEQWGEAQHLVHSSVEILSAAEIQGSSTVRGGWNKGGPYTVYFYARFDTTPDSIRIWKKNTFPSAKKVKSDDRTGAVLTFATKKEQNIQMQVGISFKSTERARARVKAETPHWSFEQTFLHAQRKWNKALNRIIVKTDNYELKQMFYTALYHSMLMPTDRTGENPDWTSDRPYYDDYYAIWDTFRTLHPLLTLIQPERQKEMLQSLLNIYQHDGFMPDARSGNANGRTQGGSNCDVLFADARAKNLTGIDYELAFKAMEKNAAVIPENPQKEGRDGLSDYKTLGYVSTDFERAGTRTLEYAYCDFALFQMAQSLNKTEKVQKYRQRANYWQHLWRPVEHKAARGFIWPRHADGSWQKDFSVLQAGSWPDFFYESHSWEYSFYVPQDVRALMQACGGREAFVARLDTFFVNDYYNVGNEPGFLTPCLYIWAGRPHKTAAQVRSIIDSHFHAGRDGLPGNDDAGAMSSWFAFHALGFYPNAGQDVYLITAPMFEKAEIIFKGGKKLVIKTKNVVPENRFIQSATLNGKPWPRAWFRHNDIENGAVFQFNMGAEPSQWGVHEPPPSLSDPDRES